MAKAPNSKAAPGQINSQGLRDVGRAFGASGGCVVRAVGALYASGAAITEAATVGVASTV
jgi:hypothetical protein